MNRKPIASLSLDLDNQWSYMKIHGDPNWDQFPSYLDVVIPRTLEMFRELNLTITFFIVGQDAALAKNWSSIRSISLAGHESEKSPWRKSILS
jgi:peptidoglycan-N-acetylglucosamine deacetylase